MGEVLRTARDIVDLALKPKPELRIHNGNLPSTAEALRDLLGTCNRLFERGVPVRLVPSLENGPPVRHSFDEEQRGHGGTPAVSAGEAR
jgi:hypothetical protein